MKAAALRLLALLLLLLSLPCFGNAQGSALKQYLAKPDAVFGWKLVKTIPGKGYRAFVLELTSQTWRSEREVDRPVWKHWLTVVKPDQAKSQTALLYIGAGSNLDPAPTAASQRAINIARDTATVVAEVMMVPNQPLRFADSPDQARVEDDIIAYTRVKHFTTKDDEWLVRLAMVKSGVRAMDAVQQFLASAAGGATKVEKFVVTGASKRGWTTWLVGAMDERVVAIIPMVIDALNSEAITRHQFEAYGFFSDALEDYVNHGLFPHKIGTPEYRAVLAIEDPFNYRSTSRLGTLPKFLLNASGDQFFLPDNSQFYFGELLGEKHLRYVPNTKHNLAESDALESLTAFYQAVLDGTPRPSIVWEKQADGALRVTTNDKPTAVKLWQASNPDARDFRLDVIGKGYTATELKESQPGIYLGRVPKPPKGFTAFFIEFTFPSGGKYPFKFSTEVSVVPDVLPFDFKDAARKYPLKKNQ